MSDIDPADEIQRLTAERDRLRYELGHRVKNTLSMVQALANQTFRGTEPPAAALATFNDRVLALARAHDVILRGNWTTSTVDAVAGGLRTMPGIPSASLTIEGPPVPLSAGSALSFAMALHELSTNARRHGAWSVPGGHVTLAWGVAADMGQGEALTLSWTERGGPPAAAPPVRGFGLRLAEQSLRSAFGRDVRILFDPAGLRVDVRAPLADLGG